MTKLALCAGCLTVLLLLPSRALAAEAPSAEPSSQSESAKKPADDDDGSKLILGLDGHLIQALEEGTHEVGSGLEARVGWHKTRLLGLLFTRPELGGGYDRILGNNMGRVFAGARIGIQFVVAAYLYGRGGYGWGAPDGGFTYDVGLGADLVLFSLIRPGVHFDYMEIVDNVQTLRGGVHVELAF